MLEIHHIRQDSEAAKARLNKRGFGELALVDKAIELDEQRRKLQTSLDETLAAQNSMAKEIGGLMKAGKKDEAEQAKSRTAALKEESKQLHDKKEAVEAELLDVMVRIPNLPNELVPAGNSEHDNEVVKQVADDHWFEVEGKPHWELADEYQLFSLETGVKITGAGFPLYKGKGARLQRALVNFFLDEAQKAGYTEYIPPYLVNEATAFGTGQLPDKDGQMYEQKQDPYFLIPTAEVPLTNIYRDVILNESELPVKLCGHSHCFRREAGSYGKDVRGLNRVHEFEKVEIVQVSHPDKSYEVLDEMVAYVEGLIGQLELPYRILRLCGGDLGFTSALTYDFEVYSAAQKRWLEVSSVSNFETFQTNRMKMRFRGSDKKTHLAHTLNGSALALPRIVAALLENNQTEEGIRMPAALQHYTGFDRIG